MNRQNVRDKSTIAEIIEGDGILATCGVNGCLTPLDMVRNCIGTSEDPQVLGVPAPTAEDEGKILSVNNTGSGYTLNKNENPADLIWENPTPSALFPAQTIHCDNTKYSTFVVVLEETYSTDMCIVIHKDGRQYNARYVRVYAFGIEEENRSICADENGFVVSNGVRWETAFDGSVAGGVNNGTLVLKKIYGLR